MGILLGGVFLMGTALIIYYKQISEGYEDKARFEIMRKVGMSYERSKSPDSQTDSYGIFPSADYGMCPYWNGISFDEKAASFGGHVKYQAVSYMYGSNSDYICSSLRRDLCSNSKILLQDFGKSRVKERWKERADMREFISARFHMASWVTAGCVMTAGFVGAVHNIQFPAAFGGNIFAGDSLHAVAGAAKTGEIDFNDFLFHGKPP